MSDVLARLFAYGHVRNRDVDHEVREITITDDEAVELYEKIERLMLEKDAWIREAQERAI